MSLEEAVEHSSVCLRTELNQTWLVGEPTVTEQCTEWAGDDADLFGWLPAKPISQYSVGQADDGKYLMATDRQ